MRLLLVKLMSSSSTRSGSTCADTAFTGRSNVNAVQRARPSQRLARLLAVGERHQHVHRETARPRAGGRRRSCGTCLRLCVLRTQRLRAWASGLRRVNEAARFERDALESLHRVVESVRAAVHLVEEPGEVLPGHLVDHGEEVVRLRVLELPRDRNRWPCAFCSSSQPRWRSSVCSHSAVLWYEMRLVRAGPVPIGGRRLRVAVAAAAGRRSSSWCRWRASAGCRGTATG